MKATIQRVSSSKLWANSELISEIRTGLICYLGVGIGDTENEIKWMAKKIAGLRIFPDNIDKMNLSLLDISGEIMVVSQFTLYGDCRKGRRPSFIESESGEKAKELYDTLVKLLREDVKKVETGEFGADMQVYIQNDGPVTLLLDSKKVF